MLSNPIPTGEPSTERLSPPEASELLATAAALQRAAQAGTTQSLLKGKNLGLLCTQGDRGEAAFFRRAAAELGAQVTDIRASLAELSSPQDVRRTARVLGRLYDAVECQGVESGLVQQIGNAAGVPVYDGLASEKHPTAHLAALLGGDAAPADNRRFVLQAVLLSTLA
jgi:ornithine carbamoyltransferase